MRNILEERRSHLRRGRSLIWRNFLLECVVTLVNELQDEEKFSDWQTLLNFNKISEVDEKVRCVDRVAWRLALLLTEWLDASPCFWQSGLTPRLTVERVAWRLALLLREWLDASPYCWQSGLTPRLTVDRAAWRLALLLTEWLDASPCCWQSGLTPRLTVGRVVWHLALLVFSSRVSSNV